MNPVKFIFSTLFSNKNVIDGAKKQPWWLAIVLMLGTLFGIKFLSNKKA